MPVIRSQTVTPSTTHQLPPGAVHYNPAPDASAPSMPTGWTGEVQLGGMRQGERARETFLRDYSHTDRDAESDRGEAIREPIQELEHNPRNLPEIPWRAGFAQRWARMPFPNSPHPDGNLDYRLRQGWRPRPLSSLPERFRAFGTHKAPRIMDIDGYQLGYNLLMEMPLELYARYEDADKKARGKYSDVADMVIQDRGMKRIAADSRGVGKVINETGIQIERGRRPATMTG